MTAQTTRSQHHGLAARMGRWSASHWKAATFGWLAFVVVAFGLGGLAGMKNIDPNGVGPGQSGRMDKILQDGFPQHAGESVLIQSRSARAGDRAFRSAIADVIARVSKVQAAQQVNSIERVDAHRVYHVRANMKPNTGVLVVTRLSTAAPIAAAAAAASEVFFQASTCDTQNTPFNIAVGGGAFTRLQKDCATPATVRRVLQHVYFVATCNVCSGAGADTTPTLKMMDYISGGNSTETPLVEGIEDLQLEYGIDIDGNGSPDCYTSNPSSPPAGELDVALCPAASLPDPVTNWSNVVAVRIHVLARNIDPSGGWKDTRTYDLGWRITGATTSASSPVGPFNDAYKRHAYSAVARIYNLSGQRE